MDLTNDPGVILFIPVAAKWMALRIDDDEMVTKYSNSRNLLLRLHKVFTELLSLILMIILGDWQVLCAAITFMSSQNEV